MKKNLISLILAASAVTGLHAQQIFNDPMNYPVGNITTNKLTNGIVFNPWVRHSGTANDSKVVNYAGSPTALAGHRYEVNQNNTDDIHRLFDPVATNGISSGAVYASFIVSLTALPNNPGGNYFAHFQDVTTNSIPEFRGRIFAVTTNVTGLPIGNPLPGTFRFGVANAAGDFSLGTGGPAAVVPVDLATNTDYQVVLKYDLDNVLASIWVNPASESDTASYSGTAADSGAVSNALAAFSFRQNTGEGVMEIRNVIVGHTFADVVTNAPAIPVIAMQPVGITNYSGNSGTMEVVASGLGATYQWYQDGNAIAGATGQTLIIPDLEATNQGNYYCTISNAAGSTNTATAFVSVNTTPTAPTFTAQPQNATNYVSSAITLTAAVFGTGPLTYQWSLNGTPISNGGNADGSVYSGTGTPILSIFNIGTNEAGTYVLTVTGGQGSTDSSNAVVTVLPPRAVSIAFLRSLEDTNTWLTTDTTTLWSITGVIINATNLTSGSTSSYYVQDGTGGLNLFVTGNSATAFRPQIGDLVTAVGQLSSFNSVLELECFNTNPYETYSIISHSNALPAPQVFSPLITNSIAYCETNLEGSLVMLTNVYWGTNGGKTFKANSTLVVTNAAGVPFSVFISGQVTNFVGSTIPSFAWTVSGVFSQFLNNTANPRNAGYELILTRYSDIVTTPPLAVTAAETHSGTSTTLTWIGVPYSYSYSVLAATDITGPYTPLVTGLTFTNTAGTYTDTNASGTSKFYRISSP